MVLTPQELSGGGVRGTVSFFSTQGAENSDMRVPYKIAIKRRSIMYKIMSANVLGKYERQIFEDSTTQARMKIIGELIGAERPDSVGIQEYGSRNQKFLPMYIPPCYAAVDFDQKWISTFYNKDKFTVTDKCSLKLTTSSNQGYRFTWAVLGHKNGGLAYIHGNLHLEYKDHETRLINASEINSELTRIFNNTEYRNLPLVITGDYNAKLETEPDVFSAIAGKYDIRSAALVAHSAENGQATFHQLGKSTGAGNALDHALVNCGITEVYRHDIIKEDSCPSIVDASDHYPVIIEFTVKENI